MPSAQFRRRGLIAMIAVALVATGGLAYAAIPDAGGVINSCYTKSSGAWRVIDTDAGQTCKSNEAALDLYSKGAADLAFLDKPEADALYLGTTQKAADSDKLDGQDSSAFLGSSAKAADSDKLDGLDSLRYLKALDSRLGADFIRMGDGTIQVGHPAEGSYPGLSLAFTCDVDGSSTLVATAQEPFTWWWDDTFGSAPAGGPYEQTFPIGNGVQRHELRSVFTRAWYTTTFDLDTSVGFDPQVEADVCIIGWTLLKTGNVSAGP